MALADDLIEATAQAMFDNEVGQYEPKSRWADTYSETKDEYRDYARAAVAAVLDTLAASEMPHTSGYRRVDFEELAGDVREGT